jgi:hypothetical protein
VWVDCVGGLLTEWVDCMGGLLTGWVDELGSTMSGATGWVDSLGGNRLRDWAIFRPQYASLLAGWDDGNI